MAVEWLTYDELADRLGIGRESARTLVKRKRWARQPGNDGRARIGVPLEEIPAGGASPGAIPRATRGACPGATRGSDRGGAGGSDPAHRAP